MNKQIFISLFIAILVCVELYCQNDSIWNKSLTIRHGSQIIPTTGKSFNVTGFESKFQKNANTFVPIFSHKSLHGLNGYQMGLAYYRKWNWGYTHSDFFYSPSLIFPKVVLQSNIFLTVLKGIEINAGASIISYADSNTLQLIRLGTTYYYKSIMASYNLRFPLSGFVYHSLSLKKFLNEANDHFQLNLSYGLDNEGLQLNVSQPMKVYSMQFSMSKVVFKKTHLQLSLGLIKIKDESEKNKYFNYGIGIKREI